MNAVEQAIDDRGNNQDHGRAMLQNFIDRGFQGSLERTALAMGWTEEQISEQLSGQRTIDDDFVMKMRGIAKERNFDIE